MGHNLDLKTFSSALEAFDEIQRLYDESTQIVKDTYDQIIQNPSISKAQEDAFKVHLQKNATYPHIEFRVTNENLNLDPRISFGVASDPGIYSTTITHPEIFKQYLIEQIGLMLEYHKIPIYIGKSKTPIPLPFVLESGMLIEDKGKLSLVKRVFPQVKIQDIHDHVPNGQKIRCDQEHSSLSLFNALRVDYSLSRLHHYTGTHPSHFQNFILLTNYHRYVNGFCEYALENLGGDNIEFIEPGNVSVQKINGEFITSGERLLHLPQMPAYHLKRKDNNGITFINIGVGPSNAKNVTDNLAVLRPHCWIMLGHCAGLRRSQELGDYILAHGYVRHDHVLDADLPPWVTIPPLAEIQTALQQAVSKITDVTGVDLKSRLRTGTIWGTDDRNWELKYSQFYEAFQQHRAIAVDMESSTLAANGFRFRIPYGTLLCVSDKPLHGELKLRGPANAFYNDRIQQHLTIGIETIHILRSQGADALHSRKLRGFEEPPFR